MYLDRSCQCLFHRRPKGFTIVWFSWLWIYLDENQYLYCVFGFLWIWPELLMQCLRNYLFSFIFLFCQIICIRLIPYTGCLEKLLFIKLRRFLGSRNSILGIFLLTFLWRVEYWLFCYWWNLNWEVISKFNIFCSLLNHVPQ